MDLSFSDDGKRIVSIGADHTLAVWDLEYRDLAELGCKKAGRNLSREEWKLHVGTEFAYRVTCDQYPDPSSSDWPLRAGEQPRPRRASKKSLPSIFSW